jgi:hypothetical protein
MDVAWLEISHVHPLAGRNTIGKGVKHICQNADYFETAKPILPAALTHHPEVAVGTLQPRAL